VDAQFGSFLKINNVVLYVFLTLFVVFRFLLCGVVSDIFLGAFCSVCCVDYTQTEWCSICNLRSNVIMRHKPLISPLHYFNLYIQGDSGGVTATYGAHF
jgi:hypothetical protein